MTNIYPSTDDQSSHFSSGLITFLVSVDVPGSEAIVTVYFDGVIPADAKWMNYNQLDGWVDYSKYAIFSADRKSVTFGATDCGLGGTDFLENNVIVASVRFEANSFVVPHQLVGKQVTLRVKDDCMRIFDNHLLIITYTIPQAKGNLAQDKRFYQALKNDRQMNKRKYQSGRRTKGRAKHTISPLKPQYDMDVQVRPLSMYDDFAHGEVRP